MKPQLAAIDLDGTLLDSVGDLHAAVVAMQSTIGQKPSSQLEVLGWIGNGIERLVHRALTGAMNGSASEELFLPAIDVFRRAYHDVNGKHVAIYPGVLAGLDWLASEDIPMCVVTNKAREFTEPLLSRTGIDHYFAHVVCGDDVTEKKPAPESLLLCTRLIGAEPSASVMIGDSVNDFRAARNAAFRLIGVSYGYNYGVAPSELSGSDKPDVIIDSFLQLPDAIGSLGS